MSFGWKSQDDEDGIEDVLNVIGNMKSVLIFASSTNDGALDDMLFPARHRGVIAVDAVDGLGKPFDITGLTDSGRRQERFSASGLNVLSLRGKRVTGSSYASPVVAGIAGLVIEAFRREMPKPEASVHKRLGTREVMKHILKLLSRQVEGFNFLTPWIELHEGGFFETFLFCNHVILGPLRLYERCGASYLDRSKRRIAP
jgi:hypothetical protein